MFALKTRQVPTLQAVFEEYIRVKGLKPKTVRVYSNLFSAGLSDWLGLPVTSITKSMVQTRHQEISKRAPVAADLTFRVLKTMLTYASFAYEEDEKPLFSVNPVQRLTDLKAWRKPKVRDRRIEQHRIKDWWQAVGALNHETHTDYLRFLLLTGMRLREAAGVQWENVDLVGGFVTVRNTKNGTDHTLPLSMYLWDMLRRRKQEAKTAWVFPRERGQGPTPPPVRSIELVRRATGVMFSCHDLRRTFTSLITECGLQDSVTKALLNHTPGDVTSGYRGKLPLEKLKDPMQAITDRVLALVSEPPKPRIRMSLEVARTGTVPRVVSLEGD